MRCLALVLALTHLSFAVTNLGLPADFVSHIKGKSIDELYLAFVRDKTETWPDLGWIPNVKTLDSTSDSPQLVITDFINKIRIESIEFISSNPTPDKVREKLLECLLWQELLKSAGGYTNLVISDSFDRAAVILIANIISRDDSLTNAVDEDIRKYCSVGLDKNFIMKEFILISSENTLEDSKSSDKNTFLLKTLKVLNSNKKNNKCDFLLLSKYSDINNQNSAIAVLYRMMLTDCEKTVVIPGYLKFKSLGGVPSELDLADITAFAKRMSGTDGEFVYPALGINVFGPEYIVDFIKNFSQIDKCGFFQR